MNPGRALRERLTFRKLQLGCVVQLGGRTFAGYTVHLSPGEFALRVEPAVDGDPPVAGTSGNFRLVHERRSSPISISGQAELMWVARCEPPQEGSELALRVVKGQEPLADFLEQLRFPILVVTPDDEAAARFREALGDFELTHVHDGADALVRLGTGEWTTVICTERLGSLSAADFLERAREQLPELSAIVAAEKYAQTAELLARVDVFHLLRPPFRASELRQATQRAVEAQALAADAARLARELERINRRLVRENTFLRRRAEASGFEHLVGQSAAWKEMLERLRCVIDVDTSIHLRGETGTGKELLARAIHAAGPRRSGPFVAYNCAGIPDELALGIFFGHRKGAFTGAERDHAGLFEQANGGTLFLDEVAELPPRVQASLLRALQERVVTPLGARDPIPVDVRVLSATNEDLQAQVRAGRFREDLYFRLVVLAITVPPLRDRKEDIPLLARHFLELQSARLGRPLPSLSSATVALLSAHRWPGNVRELENEIERLAILAEGKEAIGPELLSPSTRGAAMTAEADAGEVLRIPAGRSFDEAVVLLQRTLVDRALEETGGNVTRAAERLGIERTRFGKLRARLEEG